MGDLLNVLGWGLVWLLVLGCAAGIGFIIWFFITEAIDVYNKRHHKLPDPDPWADWKRLQAQVRAIHAKEHSDWDTEFEDLTIMKQGQEHRKNVMAFANALERRARDELYAKMQNEVVRLHEAGKIEEARDTLARLDTIKRLDAQKGF